MADPYRQPGGARKAAAAPAPFWTHIRAIALYPFRGAALWSLVTLTLCGLLAMLPMVGWIIGIVTWLAVYRYAFEILRHTANGHLEAPEHSLEVGNGTVLRLLLLTLVLFVPVGLVLAITRSPALTIVAAVCVVLLQPGCVISLAIDGSLRRALNPMVPLAVATRIGWPYLAAFGLLFVIQASAATADHWLGTWLPPVIGTVAAAAASIWGLFATFHLLGYLVYQYHDRLGFEPETGGRFDRNDPDQTLLADTEAEVAAGNLPQAMAMLRAEVRTRSVGLPVHELYHRLLGQAGQPDELREHARQYLMRLMGERQERRALALAREMLDRQPDFVPSLQEHAVALVERARQGGQYRLCTDLLLAMCRQWPRAQQASQWSLDAAMLLAERFGEDAQARGLLEQALERSEDEEQRRKLQAALKALSLSPSPAATTGTP